jgi:hypothetical protein
VQARHDHSHAAVAIGYSRDLLFTIVSPAIVQQNGTRRYQPALLLLDPKVETMEHAAVGASNRRVAEIPGDSWRAACTE